MKKRATILIAALAILALLCAGCSGQKEGQVAEPETVPAAQAAGGRDAALKEAFDGGKTIRLVPAELPSGDLGEDRAPLDLSPDGKTVLWRTGSNEETVLSLVRDGRTIPVRFTAERGAGDPYGKAEFYSGRYLGQLPGEEGLSWSGDGKYFSISDVKAATRYIESPGVAVVDTASGELYLADSMRDGMVALREYQDEFGLILTCRIDRSGKYLYYLVLQSGFYRFCRCPVEGGDREILCETEKGQENQLYDFIGSSVLKEAADGSWVVTGINGSSSKPPKDTQLSLIRFIQAGDAWTTEVLPTGIMYEPYGFGSPYMEGESGYGILTVDNLVAGQMSNAAVSATADAAASVYTMGNAMLSLSSHIGLVRFRAGDLSARDIWYIQWHSEDPADVTMEPAEELLWAYKLAKNVVYPGEEEEAKKRMPEDGDYYVPEGFDPEGSIRGTDWMRITGVCVSPDGYYALVNAGNGNTCRLYLVDLESMKIRLLETPENLDTFGMNGSGMKSYYRPRMKWNEDGTLLIVNGKTQKAEAFHLETGE